MSNNSSVFDFKTIIWDWNGTLLNDVWLCVEIANKMLVDHNELNLDTEGYRAVFGFPITDYYQKIGIDLKKESFEVLTTKFVSSYGIGVKKCQLHQNAVDTLKMFASNKMDQYILTAAHKESVMPLLAHYSILEYFIEIEGLDNHRAESKVDRGMQLIENNKIKIDSAVLIGDTIHDLEVAKAIGVDCILIANGHQSKNRLENEKGSVAVLDDLKELMENLKF